MMRIHTLTFGLVASSVWLLGGAIDIIKLYDVNVGKLDASGRENTTLPL
jgi:hypothetical protein